MLTQGAVEAIERQQEVLAAGKCNASQRGSLDGDISLKASRIQL